MGDKTAISWTHFFGPNSGATWNPIAAYRKQTGARGWACVKWDPACDNCYAQHLNMNSPFKMGTGLPYILPSLKDVDLKLVNLDQPLRWNKPRGIFTISMSDLFGSFVPEEYRRAIFVVMALADQHIFITLTKRIPEMVEWYIENKNAEKLVIPQEYLTKAIFDASSAHALRGGEVVFPPKHVIVGITIGHDAIAKKSLPHMRKFRNHFPSATIMVSYEPAIGPVDWSGWEGIIDWMVVGGESGDKARPMDPVWARVARDWSTKNSVPFYFKQWGSWSPDGEMLITNPAAQYTFPSNFSVPMYKVGKRTAGNLLDGKIWNEFPQTVNRKA